MKITPLDIEKIEFKTGLFGYNKKNVRDFLNELSEDLTKLLKENSDLQEKNSELQKIREDYQAMEKRLQSTLMIIQDFKLSVQETAKKEAEQNLNEAKLHCNIMINDAERKVSNLKKEYDTLLLEKVKIIEKIKFFLKEQMAVVESFTN